MCAWPGLQEVAAGSYKGAMQNLWSRVDALLGGGWQVATRASSGASSSRSSSTKSREARCGQRTAAMDLGYLHIMCACAVGWRADTNTIQLPA